MKKFFFGLIILFFFCSLTPLAHATAGGHSSGRSSSGRSSFSNSHWTGGNDYSSYGRRRSYYGSSYHDQSDLLISSVGIFSMVGILFYRFRKGQTRPDISKRAFIRKLPGVTFAEQKQVYHELMKVFFEVQEAWDKEQPELARKYYTARLLQEHTEMLHTFQEKQLRNRTMKVRFHYFAQFCQLNANSIRVKVVFSAIDYLEDTALGEIVDGSQRKRQEFWQTWYFNYEDGSWKADYISEH